MTLIMPKFVWACKQFREIYLFFSETLTNMFLLCPTRPPYLSLLFSYRLGILDVFCCCCSTEFPSRPFYSLAVCFCLGICLAINQLCNVDLSLLTPLVWYNFADSQHWMVLYVSLSWPVVLSCFYINGYNCHRYYYKKI